MRKLRERLRYFGRNPFKFDEINNREQLILKASPKCPFCHTINSNIPRWK